MKSFSKADFQQYYLEIQSTRDVERKIKLAKEEGREEGKMEMAIGMIKRDKKTNRCYGDFRITKRKS